MASREPFYHDFSRLGLRPEQLPPQLSAVQALSEGHLAHRRNQEAKEPVITAYILWAIAKLRTRGEREISFAELFCADGYYTMFARKFGADSACGFDNDRDGFLANAAIARDLLGLDRVDFHQMDVHEIPDERRFSIVANIGGLYHVSDPVDVLLKSSRMAERFLIVQTAVSLATTDENYFETPAPGWTWGCRFSRQSFEKRIRDLGFYVVDSEFNHLSGNPRPEDRGSVYYLIDTERTRPVQVSTAADYRDLPAGSAHYRAFVGPPKQYDLIGASQFRLLTSLGMRETHSLLDFGCGSLRAGRFLLAYLNPGNYYGIEPNRYLVDDAFRFELGEDMRRLRRPAFSDNADFRIPFDRTFDYIVLQSIFTHSGVDIAERLLSEIERALAPGGMAVASFLQVDQFDSDTGAARWVYPACVNYTADTIARMAGSAGLEARRLEWFTPRVTWFLLTRPGECRLGDAQLRLLRGPVLLEPDCATSQTPAGGELAVIDGSEFLICGSVYRSGHPALGFVDRIEQRGTAAVIHGWAVDPRTKSPPVFVVAALHRQLLRTADYGPVVRADVCEHLNLAPGLAAGFTAAVAPCAPDEFRQLRVFAVFPEGAAELRRSTL